MYRVNVGLWQTHISPLSFILSVACLFAMFREIDLSTNENMSNKRQDRTHLKVMIEAINEDRLLNEKPISANDIGTIEKSDNQAWLQNVNSINYNIENLKHLSVYLYQLIRKQTLSVNRLVKLHEVGREVQTNMWYGRAANGRHCKRLKRAIKDIRSCACNRMDGGKNNYKPARNKENPFTNIVMPNKTRSLTNNRKKKNPIHFQTSQSQFLRDIKNYDVRVDLSDGTVTGEHVALSWLVPPERTGSCSSQGMARIRFNDSLIAGGHSKVLIDMWFGRPEGWLFNIGDSLYNDGWSGDGHRQENDCEIQGKDRSFSVISSDKAQDPLKKIIYSATDFILDRVTLIITDQQVIWNNHEGSFDFVRDKTLFALKGQPDRQGPINYDVYFGMNRVVAGTYRSGQGLCRIGLKWLG